MNRLEGVKKPLRTVADQIIPARRRQVEYRRLVGMLVREGHVQAGPFAGMKYLAETGWGQLAPLLLGTYEAELHPAFDRLLQRDYERVVDIGCAEGDCAVGLAIRLPSAQVYAVDSDARSRALCAELAQINGVNERVTVCDVWTSADLEAAISEARSLVVVDCEGCELTLLDPLRAPSLRHADLVVELRDCVDPQITGAMLKRFAPTHSVSLLDVATRDPADYSLLRGRSSYVQQRVLDERRPTEPHPMQWSVLKTRSALAGSGD